MGAAASLSDEQQLKVYEKMRDYMESKDAGEMTDAQRQLYDELRQKFKHFASDVRKKDGSGAAAVAASKSTRQSYFLNLMHREHDGLLVGDIVRVRDRHDESTSGMWFEGLLVGIDVATDAYTVVLEDSEVTVGGTDIQRVRPWNYVEPGDAVECRPDGQGMWFAGTVTGCDPRTGMYTVMMDGDDTPEEVRDDQIRKVHSMRTHAARRWRRAMIAVAGLHRINSPKLQSRGSWESSSSLDVNEDRQGEPAG